MKQWESEHSSPVFDLHLVGSPSKHLSTENVPVGECVYTVFDSGRNFHEEGDFGGFNFHEDGGFSEHGIGKVSSFEEALRTPSSDSSPTNAFSRPGIAEPIRQNKLTQGLAMITNLCFEGFDHLEHVPQVLIKLRNVLMETIYYCIEVNRQVYEEFVFSIQQKSKLYMEHLIHKALMMCQSDSRSTTCYHVIKCVHDITLLTFTFTNPYKFTRLLEQDSPLTSQEGSASSEDSWIPNFGAESTFSLVQLLKTNRSLINSMTEIKENFANPKSNELVNDTPRDLFRFEFKEILSLLKRINSILLNNCIPDEGIFAYYAELIHEGNYTPHDLDSLEEYLCHFSRLQDFVKQVEVSPNTDPFYSQFSHSLRKRKARYHQKQRRENSYNRLHSLGPLFHKDKKSGFEDDKENARFHLYQKLRQKGIEIHPNGTHNIHVTTEFLRQVDEKKSQIIEEIAQREILKEKRELDSDDQYLDPERSPSTFSSSEDKEIDEKVQYISQQKKLIQNSFQALICNFPKLKWCTPLQSINYLQIFVDLYNEIYHEDLVIEQNYDESGNMEDTVIRRMDDVFNVKRGHYNFREHVPKEVKIPDFVNFFNKDLPEEDGLISQKSEIHHNQGNQENVPSVQHSEGQSIDNVGPDAGEVANGTVNTNRVQNEFPNELKMNLLKHEEALTRYRKYHREYDSKYQEAYEVLCESEHINQAEQWSAYFSHLKEGFDSDRMHITNCKIGYELEKNELEKRKSLTGSETGEETSPERLPSFTSPSASNEQNSDPEFPEGGKIPLSLKVFQLNEAVAYEVRNIRADYEDAHVVRKVEFKRAKCYKCKYIPWHKH